MNFFKPTFESTPKKDCLIFCATGLAFVILVTVITIFTTHNKELVDEKHNVYYNNSTQTYSATFKVEN